MSYVLWQSSASSNGKSITPNIKPTAAVIDFSVTVCEKLLPLRNTQATDVGTYSYFDTSLKIDARDNHGAWQYFPFIRTIMLPEGALEDFLSTSKNKDARNTFLKEKILNHDFGNVTFSVTVHDSVSGNKASQIGSSKKGS